MEEKTHRDKINFLKEKGIVAFALGACAWTVIGIGSPIGVGY